MKASDNIFEPVVNALVRKNVLDRREAALDERETRLNLQAANIERDRKALQAQEEQHAINVKSGAAYANQIDMDLKARERMMAIRENAIRERERSFEPPEPKPSLIQKLKAIICDCDEEDERDDYYD